MSTRSSSPKFVEAPPQSNPWLQIPDKEEERESKIRGENLTVLFIVAPELVPHAGDDQAPLAGTLGRGL